MNWVLIYMTCMRFCDPQYVEPFPTKVACEAKLKATEGRWGTNNKCVPVAKE